MKKLIVLLCLVLCLFATTVQAANMPTPKLDVNTTLTIDPSLGKSLTEQELRDVVVLLRDYGVLLEKMKQIDQERSTTGDEVANLKQQVALQQMVISNYEIIISLYEKQMALYEKNLQITENIASKYQKIAESAESENKWLKWSGILGFVIGVALMAVSHGAL